MNHSVTTFANWRNTEILLTVLYPCKILAQGCATPSVLATLGDRNGCLHSWILIKYLLVVKYDSGCQIIVNGLGQPRTYSGLTPPSEKG